MRTARRLVPVVVGAAALVVYFRTLYPGQGGGGDAAKFQYLGSVLGTAHPPGYPLYIFVSWLFSHVPIGTLAYRMNLLSACLGVATVLLTYFVLVGRRCHVGVAAAAALGLAFDRYFWSKTLGAEVYSLNAAMLMLVVWQMLRWEENGRRRDLYVAAGLFGLSLGNHLTAATLAPALALFVLVSRPDTVRLGPVAISVLLGLLGLTQYGFILIRTWQNAPFVEARATNLGELKDVVFASKYSTDMFQYTWHQIWTERAPRVWRLFAEDLGPLGTAAFWIGLVASVVTRQKAALLIGGGLLGIAVLTLNVDADVDGFLVPAFALAWLIAGLGLQAVWSFAARGGRAGIAAMTVVLAAIPIWQVQRNYRPNDHHLRTYETRYFTALFDRLESRTAIVRESYGVDQLVLYNLVGEQAARGRTVELVARDLPAVQRYARDGFAIYVFDTGRAALEGLGFQFEAVQLHERLPGDARTTRGGPIDMTHMRLFRMVRWAPCATVGNQGWTDITAVVAGGPAVLRFDNYRAFDSTAVFYAGGEVGTVRSGIASSQGPTVPTATVTTFRRDSPADAAKLAALVQQDGVPNAAALLALPEVRRVDLRVNDDGQFSQSIVGAAGPGTSLVLLRATVDLDNPRRAIVCGWPGQRFFAGGTREALSFTADEDMLFGRGWRQSAPADSGAAAREVVGSSAELAVTLERAGAVQIQLNAKAGDDARSMTLSVNGRPLGSRTLSRGWQPYAWEAPEGAFAVGVNRLTVEIGGVRPDAAAGEPAAAVSAMTFDLSESQRSVR